MEPRPAATVLLARPGDRTVEILVLRRTHTSRFAPDFVVFPGGVLDPGDKDLAWRLFRDPNEAPRACALRELYEETGLVLTADGLQATDGRAPLMDVEFLPPPPEALVEIGRWVAPEFLEIRFDARFYAAAAPRDVEPVADGIEIDDAWWDNAHDVLELSSAGDAPLMWPTLVMLNELKACRTVEDVLALQVPQIEPPIPRPGPSGGPRAFRPEDA